MSRYSTRKRKAPERFEDTIYAYDILNVHLTNASEEGVEDYFVALFLFFKPKLYSGAKNVTDRGCDHYRVVNHVYKFIKSRKLNAYTPGVNWWEWSCSMVDFAYRFSQNDVTVEELHSTLTYLRDFSIEYFLRGLESSAEGEEDGDAEEKDDEVDEEEYDEEEDDDDEEEDDDDDYEEEVEEDDEDVDYCD